VPDDLTSGRQTGMPWISCVGKFEHSFGRSGGTVVGRFAQHTKLVATRGNADLLASKFIESVEMQRTNPACELMIVYKSPVEDDVVYLTEVWSSESEWEEARSSPVIAEWAKDMPTLVAEAPQSVLLDPVGGKGLS
jgi:quinol monooxygenase YgiN